MKKLKMNNNTFMIIAIFLLIFITIPSLVVPLAPAGDLLDTSWVWVLEYALVHHLQWGKQIISTEGPLGFLRIPYFYSDHLLWFIASISQILAKLSFSLLLIYFLYFYIIKNKKDNIDNRIFFYYVLIVAIAIITFSFTAYFTTVTSIATAFYIMGVLIIINTFDYDFTNNRIITIRYILSGILLALSSLIKFNVIPLAVVFLLLYPFLIGYSFKSKKLFVKSFIGLISFVVAFLLILKLTGQDLINIPSMLVGVYEIIKGYAQAMYLNGNHVQTFIAIITILYFLYLILISYKKKQKVLFSQLILLFLILFLSFKEGFIRHDPGLIGGHALYFFTVSLIVIAFTILIYSKLEFSSNFLNLIFILIFCFNIIGGAINILPPYNFIQFLELISSKHARTQYQQFTDNAIRSQSQLPPSIVQAVANNPVTIIAWNLMMAQGYHFKFIPEVIPQTYSAYTPYLDEQNAKQILNNNNLQNIIYSFQDIDGRYPLFSEPYTFDAILSCYKLKIPGNPYSLFTRKNSCNNLNLFPISTIRAEFNQWVKVPQNAEFMDIEFKNTLLSHIIDILYKPLCHIYIYIQVSNNAVAGPLRVVPMVYRDHLFIKYLITNQNDLINLMNGETNNLLKIKALKIVVKGINLEYDKHYHVKFYVSSD